MEPRLLRFLSINQLDHVLEEDFLQVGLTFERQEDNKLVFYILEDAVAGASVAAKYVSRAALWNGNEAYYLLYAGYALSGPAHAAFLQATSASILMRLLRKWCYDCRNSMMILSLSRVPQQ